MVRIIGGFVAGVLAVLIFHQSMVFLLKAATALPIRGVPWSMAPLADAFGMPTVANQAFWGGLWGIVYAFIGGRLPGPVPIRGLIFGMIFPMLLGSWLIVPLVKKAPILAGLLADGNVMRLVPGLLINGVAYGPGVALIYWLLSSFGANREARTA